MTGKGRRRDTQLNRIAAALVVIPLGIGGIAWWRGHLPTSLPFGKTLVRRPNPAKPPIVTKAEFDQAQEGLAYEQVVAIIGASGQSQAAIDPAGPNSAMYVWMNPDGSNMVGVFKDGKLVQKAQFILP